ncbi:MAG: hypothetical protein ACREME_04190, partial [Gemmatimonadales bacterium]
VRADGALQSAAAVLTLLRGGGQADQPTGRQAGNVWWGRGRTIRVEVLEGAARPVQLDGEVTGHTPFEARLLPAALTVLVGPNGPSQGPNHG